MLVMLSLVIPTHAVMWKYKIVSSTLVFIQCIIWLWITPNLFEHNHCRMQCNAILLIVMFSLILLSDSHLRASKVPQRYRIIVADIFDGFLSEWIQLNNVLVNYSSRLNCLLWNGDHRCILCQWCGLHRCLTLILNSLKMRVRQAGFLNGMSHSVNHQLILWVVPYKFC